MDEREQVEQQVEDLEIDGADAEQVKGGADVHELEKVSFVRGASPQLGKGRDGVEHQHNETLVVI